jgi:DNA-directed RNA polymerase subunit RPC12/RpoP
MAQCIRFACDNCSNDIEAWDDGNPYYFDRRGVKKYAYHPDPNFERCVGNDSARLCLECGAQALVDSRTQLARCPTCSSDKIVSLSGVAGRRCPFCKLGILYQDRDFFCVS